MKRYALIAKNLISSLLPLCEAYLTDSVRKKIKVMQFQEQIGDYAATFHIVEGMTLVTRKRCDIILAGTKWLELENIFSEKNRLNSFSLSVDSICTIHISKIVFKNLKIWFPIALVAHFYQAGASHKRGHQEEQDVHAKLHARIRSEGWGLQGLIFDLSLGNWSSISCSLSSTANRCLHPVECPRRGKSTREQRQVRKKQ